MKYLRATESQKLILDKLEFGPHKIQFIESKIGWIVAENVLNNYAYAPFLPILEKLERVDFELPEPDAGLWTSIKNFFS